MIDDPRSPRRRLRVLTAVLLVALGAGLGAGPATAQQPSAPQSSADDYRETADEVLSRREFQRPEPTILERVREWIGDRLDSLVDSLTGGGAGSVVGWAVLALALGALIWSLTRLGRTVRADPAATAQLRIDRGRTPDEWREEAARLEARGDWKRALRCRYRALLGDLVRRGVIDDVPGRTTGEYRREVEHALPGARAAFGEATELFESAWYADGPTGPDETGRFTAAAVSAVAAAEEPGARGRSPVGVR